MQDVLGNQVPAGLVALAIAAPHIKAGKLKLLGVTQSSRSAMFPSVPTIGESIKGFDATAWLGLFAPVGTPAEIVKLLSAEIRKILLDTATRQHLESQALDAIPAPPEQVSQRIATESSRWGRLIQTTGIKVD